MGVNFGSGTALSAVQALQATRASNASVTWDSTGTGAWSSPGGDTATQAGDVEPVSSSGGAVWWYLTSMVQNWVSNPSADFGVMLADDGAGGVAGAYTHLYDGGSRAPALTVTWVPRVGDPSGSPTVDVPAGGGSALTVNTANGEVGFSDPLLELKGAGGMDLMLGAR